MPSPESGFGVDTCVTVALRNQPGSGCVPSVVRKSFRTYWFSLNTPLRDGRSATQPEPTATAARALTAKRARKVDVFMILSVVLRSVAQNVVGQVGIEQRGADDAPEAAALRGLEPHAVGQI